MQKVNFAGLLNFFLFICFCLGIILGNFLPHFLIFLALSLIALSLVYIFYRYRKLFLSDLFILIFFLFLGALWQIPASIRPIDKFLKKENTITLQVISLPKTKGGKNAFAAEVKEINSYRIKQRIKVTDYTQSMDYLNFYQLRGKIVKRKYRNYLYYSLRVKKKANPKELPLGVLAGFRKKSADYILNVFRDNCSKQGYRFLSAVFLGRREVLEGEKEVFSNAGVSHIPPVQCRRKHSYSIASAFAV